MSVTPVDRERLHAAAETLQAAIATLQRRLSITEIPLLVALILVIWLAVVESAALGMVSEIWFGVGFLSFKWVLLRFVFPSASEGEWIQSKGSRFLIIIGWIYVLLSEYVLGIKHLDFPARSGFLFQHLPSFLVLLAAANLKEAVVSLVGCLVLVLPLASSWWQINNLVIHGCMVCFASWIKTNLIDITQKCEALLEVREAIMQETIATKQKKLESLDAELKSRAEGVAQLTNQMTRLQRQYEEMSDMAEEAVSMISARYRCKC